MNVNDSMASLAYTEIAHRLFGPDAFLTAGFLSRPVVRWLGYTCANTYNRFRKTYNTRTKTVDKLEAAVQAKYSGGYSSLHIHRIAWTDSRNVNSVARW